MKSAPLIIAASFLTLTACGSGESTPSKGPSSKGPTTGSPSTSTGDTSGSANGFNPPPVLEGYTRLVAQTVKDVEPGGDVTYCQYLMAPLDHDVDVLGVMGYQSKWGHHAVAMTYTPQDGEEVGTTFSCMGTEFTSNDPTQTDHSLSMGTFLGAVGGADTKNSTTTTLPEGVATRLKAGNGVMLNLHYLNSGDQIIDGNAVVDLKLEDASPDRQLASLFLNGNFNFDLSPSSQTSSTIDCVAQSDVQVIMMSNHMHEFGTSASTQVIRAGGGAMEDVHTDKTWTYDMQFNAVFTRWEIASPFTLHAGDTVRTTCNWDNTTAQSMKFPREMCFGVGFALTTGDHPASPVCLNGAWLDQGI